MPGGCLRLIVAEKPSMGRALAEALGLTERGRNLIEGKGLVVTWCVGHLVEALNPKTAGFFLAFIPQFVDPGAGGVALQFVLLGCVSVALNTLVDIVVALAAGQVRERVMARPGVIRRLREASGAAMIALGAGLALTRRPVG